MGKGQDAAVLPAFAHAVQVDVALTQPGLSISPSARMPVSGQSPSDGA